MTADSLSPAVVTVTANPALDVTYLLPPGAQSGEVGRASRSTLEASGKGVNVSRALHAVGVPTFAVLPVGGPTGRCLVELLEDEAVPHRVVAQEGHTRINTTALRPGAGTVKLNGPGAGLPRNEQEALLAATGLALEDARSRHEETWLAVCGSLPPGVEAALVTELVELGHAHGARCAVDVSGEALEAALGARVDVLAPNRDELAEALDGGTPIDSVDRLVDVAVSVSQDTGSHLLISMGADGALYTDGVEVLHATAPPLTPVNTAGAGDALLAGWLSTTHPGRDRLAAAVRWGRSACLSPTTVDSRPGRRDTAPVTVTDLASGRLT
jgi:1-phosphofructokinase